MYFNHGNKLTSAQSSQSVFSGELHEVNKSLDIKNK